MVSLTEIQNLIYRCVDALSRPLPAVKRESLTKGLEALRSAERDYLAQHKSVLRKGLDYDYEGFLRDYRKVTTEPAAADRPNAPSPAEALPTRESRAFRAPAELSGHRIYTVGGHLDIPSHGIVHIAAPPDGHDEDKCDCVHCGMVRDLKGRGFKEQRARKSSAEKALDGIRDVHRLGKARMIAAELIGKQRGENAHGDVHKWLADRNTANNTSDPIDSRPQQHQGGPGPAPTYATSAAAFRRRFFGEN